MIVPMSKVTVLALERDRDAALERLRDIGALHLEAVRPAESEDVEAARKDFEYARQALEVLPRQAVGEPSDQPAAAIVRDIWTILHRRDEIADEREALLHERERIAPFGSFDPAAVRALAARGVFIRLYQAAAADAVATPAGAVRIDLSRTKSAVYFAVVSYGEPASVAAREARLPDRSLADLDRHLEELERESGGLDARLARHAADRAAVAAMADEAADRLRLAEARAGMGTAGHAIVYLVGFCPADSVDRLRDAARENGWGLLVSEPAPGDRAPTLLRLPGWARPIEPLMKFIGILPGYEEVDISGMFLVFFSLFFAMLVGDAGYGLLFLGATLAVRRRLPRPLARLMATMSAATLAWGVLTGTWFGVQPERWWRVPWLADPENVKRLCFMIAVTHLSLAHLWNILRTGLRPAALAQVGWLGLTWTMFFFANAMVLGAPFPRAMLPVFAVSAALIAAFMTPLRQLKTEWFNHVMLPLNIVGNFVDVVSYIRLYAVGTASFAVADNLNRMLAPMLGSWRTAAIGAVFLLLAHALNIALALMGVMVHGVRLNTLEFSGHMGLQWTGLPYRPFRRVRDEREAA